MSWGGQQWHSAQERLIPLLMQVGPGLGVADADTTKIGGSSHRALIVTLIIPHAGG